MLTFIYYWVCFLGLPPTACFVLVYVNIYYNDDLLLGLLPWLDTRHAWLAHTFFRALLFRSCHPPFAHAPAPPPVRPRACFLVYVNVLDTRHMLGLPFPLFGAQALGVSVLVYQGGGAASNAWAPHNGKVVVSFIRAAVELMHSWCWQGVIVERHSRQQQMDKNSSKYCALHAIVSLV